MNLITPANAVLRAFDSILHLTTEQCSLIGTEAYPIPRFRESVIENLCDDAIASLKTQSQLVDVSIPAYVVGDLHGNLHDLVRIWTMIPDPFDKTILFLGDFVDRGDYSLEIVLLILALRIQYPRQIFMIRGNHEFSTINAKYGFKSDIENIFGSEKLWEKMNEVFSYIPLSAILGGKFFCVHGGLSPHLTRPINIADLPFPMPDMLPGLVTDLVWSDPSSSISEFVQSPRGIGFTFGQIAVSSLMKKWNLKGVIRAHEKLQNGIRESMNVITVFSTSGYTGNNSGGFCHMIDEQTIEKFYFRPIRFPKRDSAVFVDAPEFGKRAKIARQLLNRKTLQEGISPLRLSARRLSARTFVPDEAKSGRRRRSDVV